MIKPIVEELANMKWTPEMDATLKADPNVQKMVTAEAAAYLEYKKAIDAYVDVCAGADVLLAEGESEAASAEVRAAKAAENQAYQWYDAAVKRLEYTRWKVLLRFVEV